MKKKKRSKPRSRVERAAEIIRQVRRTHPMRDLRVPSARELAWALDKEGMLR